MLSLAQAVASDLVSWTSPPLLGPYAGENETPKMDIIEPMLMILPPPTAFIGAYAAREHRKALVRVGIEDVMPLGERVVLGLLADVGPRVVHEDVETTAPVDRGFDQRIDRRLVRDIDGDRERLAAELLERAHGRVGLRLVAGGHDHASARAREPRAMPRPIPPLPPVTIATLPLRSNMNASGAASYPKSWDGT